LLVIRYALQRQDARSPIYIDPGIEWAGYLGGSGDDVMISSDDGEVDKVNGGDDFDDCLFGAGDEVSNCEY